MILPALILNDYPGKPYATWVKDGVKTIETRMNRLFSHRGDIVICCGKANSEGSPNAGLAMCIVDVYKGRPMVNSAAEIAACCIEWDANRKSLLFRHMRHFSPHFEFAPFAIKRNFQGVFSIEIPNGVSIIERPDIIPFPELENTLF